MPILVQWILVISAAAIVDLLVRFRLSPSFAATLWAEAVLFPLTGVVLLLLLKAGPRLKGFRRGLQVVLVWTFFLAGVRAGIWAMGFRVGTANLVIFFAALFGWLGYRVTGGGRRKRENPDTSP